MDANPWVSVLIVCHNDGKWLPRCFASLRSQTIFSHCEIIVADNASSDGSDRLARDLMAGWPNARFYSTGGDHGFCVGTNFAARQARGKYLHVLNPDTWLEDDCLAQLYETLEREKAGAGGPTILNYDDDSLQSPCPAGFDFCGNLILPKRVTSGYRPFSPGGFFFINRELFLRIGMLDEEFFMYGEETDLAWRIWIAGEKVAAAVEARIHHRGAVGVNPTGETVVVENRTSTQKRFLANRNRLLTILKNSQHVLLLTFLPSGLLVLLEGLGTWLATRNAALAHQTSIAAFGELWRLRQHILARRRFLRPLRRHSDFWLLRFFRIGFGRWSEISGILRRGFPKFR